MDTKDNEKKKVDPGWNDPPMLNYSPSNPPPKSRITNKRVAFPLNSSTAGTSSPSVPNIKPVIPPIFSPIHTLEKQGVTEQERDLFRNTKDNFGKFVLTNRSQKTKECIHLLYKSWEDGKFSDDCQKSIYLLSQYLAEKDMVNANVIKDSLLLEFKESCEDWLVNLEI